MHSDWWRSSKVWKITGAVLIAAGAGVYALVSPEQDDYSVGNCVRGEKMVTVVACWESHDGRVVGLTESMDDCRFRADAWVPDKGACVDTTR